MKEYKTLTTARVQGDWYCGKCAPPIPSDLNALSVKELKDILTSRNVGVHECVEKGDLVDKIRRIFLV
jgi:hypothetical protein